MAAPVDAALEQPRMSFLQPSVSNTAAGSKASLDVQEKAAGGGASSGALLSGVANPFMTTQLHHPLTMYPKHVGEGWFSLELPWP